MRPLENFAVIPAAPSEGNVTIALEPTRPEAPPSTDVAELERTYRPPTGLWGWLTTVDHKSIGKRYIATAFIWFLLAGVNAALMRLQLSRPENGLFGPDAYNQLFTVHGTGMMFLFAVPIMEAFALYLVPLMVGTRNIAYPRLNAFGFWMFLFGSLLLYFSILGGDGLYGAGSMPDVHRWNTDAAVCA